jgi:hypothetical protein
MKYKTLIVNGCSHTFGAETINDGDHQNPDNINHSWASHLAKKLSIDNYINLSRCGQPNQSIYLKTVNYICNNEINGPTLCIIQWSYFNRVSLYESNKIEHFINPGYYVKENKDIPEFHMLAKDVYLNYLSINPENYISWLVNNITLTEFLKSKNIDYFFYNSQNLMSEDIPESFRNLLPLLKNNLFDYSMKWNSLLSKKFTVAKDGHFKEDGHRWWAEMVHEKLMDRI